MERTLTHCTYCGGVPRSVPDSSGWHCEGCKEVHGQFVKSLAKFRELVLQMDPRKTRSVLAACDPAGAELYDEMLLLYSKVAQTDRVAASGEELYVY
jgi:hypothetical protein